MPGDAKLVLEPTALLGLRDCGKPFPVVIDLLLRVTTDQKGNRFVERKLVFVRAVHRGEPLAPQHKVGKHHRAFLIRFLSCAIAGNRAHLRVLEYREVMVDRLFCPAGNVAHKHQRWNDKRSLVPLGIGENELPGKSVFILHPAESLAERVFVQRHQRRAAFRQPLPGPIKVVSRIFISGWIEINKERRGGVEFEQGTRADRHEGLPRKLEGDDIGISGGCVVESRDIRNG